MSDHFVGNQIDVDRDDAEYSGRPKIPSVGNAFVKGGCWCLISYGVYTMFRLFVFGGSLSISDIPLGMAFLDFCLGGIAGLIVWGIYVKGYKKGWQDAGGE